MVYFDEIFWKTNFRNQSILNEMILNGYNGKYFFKRYMKIIQQNVIKQYKSGKYEISRYGRVFSNFLIYFGCSVFIFFYFKVAVLVQSKNEINFLHVKILLFFIILFFKILGSYEDRSSSLNRIRPVFQPQRKNRTN